MKCKLAVATVTICLMDSMTGGVCMIRNGLSPERCGPICIQTCTQTHTDAVTNMILYWTYQRLIILNIYLQDDLDYWKISGCTTSKNITQKFTQVKVPLEISNSVKYQNLYRVGYSSVGRHWGQKHLFSLNSVGLTHEGWSQNGFAAFTKASVSMVW